MRRALEAGVAYFAIVFAVGFVLGAVRVLVLAPRVGETLAVAAELPVMLAVSWLACRGLIARRQVPREPGARLAMGGLAFGLLMAAEAGLSVLAFGGTLAAYVAAYLTATGGLGFLGQLAFALFPLVQLRWPADRARHD